jgi:TATA-box binding protein (TBP) (component of TFIID and TFIIIB)
MKLNLSERLLLMKIKLALTTEKLMEYNQESFAGYIYATLAQMNDVIDSIRSSDDRFENATKMGRLVEHLTEIENVLLACKVGIKLPLDESTLNTVQQVKAELKELIRREQFVAATVR